MKTIILGIDPGSRCTGYGIIWVEGSHQGHIAHGVIRTDFEEMEKRLYQIYETLSRLIDEHQPHEAAIEQIFMNQNPQSALKLGQARGAALVAIASKQLSLSEYSPREVKQAVVGYGAAEKKQIQHMIGSLLSLKKTISSDAADALAIALCHANSRQLRNKIGTNLK